MRDGYTMTTEKDFSAPLAVHLSPCFIDKATAPQWLKELRVTRCQNCLQTPTQDSPEHEAQTHQTPSFQEPGARLQTTGSKILTQVELSMIKER